MVHFIEMSGVDAERALRRVAVTCRAGGDRTELLHSDDQPGLYLLICWGEGPGDLPDAGLRRWSFRPVGDGERG